MKKSKVIILGEDAAHCSIVREFLKERGYSHRQIRSLPVPGRGGSGEAYVRKEFPKYLTAIRSRQNIGLITIIDADAVDYQQRVEQLRCQCQENGIDWRTAEESAVIAVPARNIETWFVYLTSEGEWSEEKDEWKRKKNKLARPAARSLHRMCYNDQRLREPSPPSLRQACEEWKRM